MLEDRASSAVAGAKECMSDVKDFGVDSVEKIGQKIGERPLLRAAISVWGIGFILARLLSTKG